MEKCKYKMDQTDLKEDRPTISKSDAAKMYVFPAGW